MYLKTKFILNFFYVIGLFWIQIWTQFHVFFLGKNGWIERNMIKMKNTGNIEDNFWNLFEKFIFFAYFFNY